MTHDKTTVGDRIVQRLPQARDLRNGQCRIDGTDQRSDGVRRSAYGETAAHHHHHRARRGRTEHTSRRHIDTTAGEETPLIASLRERFVILRADFVVARKASDVTNNADDRLPWKQWPSLIRRPTGSVSGQYRAAIAWLMMTTGGEAVVSNGVKSRPLSNGMRIARKNPGSTSHDSAGWK